MHGRRTGRAILLLLLLCSALAAGESAAQPSAEIVARGKALVEAGDCASCHTADPAKPFAGGRRIATPFGGVYAPNLTPDRETGLGSWSDEDFLRALRHGIAPDGSRYYPAFPYPYFTKLTRDDILAIRAYLATLEPVRKATTAAGIAVSLQLPRGDAGVELAVPQARHHHAGPGQGHGVESRPLSG